MKTKRFIWVGMCALLFLVLPSRSEFIRKWTSQDGSTIQARFADMSGSDVILQTADGGLESATRAQ